VQIPAASETQDVGVFCTSHEEGTTGTAEFAGFETTAPSTGLPTVDTTDAGDATFSGSGGDYTIEAAGADVWQNRKSFDEYGAVYEADVAGDVVASVTVERQEHTHEWAKAGLMVADDVTAAGSSTGDLVLAVTPANGYVLQWDDDGDGYVETGSKAGSTTYPAALRVTKSGTEFTGEYSTDGGSTWTAVDTVQIPAASETQDVGVFCTSHEEGTTGTAEFTGFETV
jgi:hypothetical protein